MNTSRAGFTCFPLVRIGILAVLLQAACAIDSKAQAEQSYESGQRRTQARRTLHENPPRKLVDIPTAGTLPRAVYDIGMHIYQDGGALASTDIALSNRFQLGIAYGARDFFSNRTPSGNPRIAFALKFRLVDEMAVLPAIAVGYDDQGNGPYHESQERYTFKSRGFYAVASRSFQFMNWSAAWHGGINYSLEYKKDEDKLVNAFVGFDAIFDYNVGLLAEYDLALNDDNKFNSDSTAIDVSGRGRGYLNVSVKWLFTESLEIELIARDLLVNRREAETFTREMRITYIARL